MSTVKDVLEQLGISEIRDMLNPELRNSALLDRVCAGLDKDKIKDEPSFLEWLKSKGKFFIWLFLIIPVAATGWIIKSHFDFTNWHFVNLSNPDSDNLKGYLGATILIVIIAVIMYLVFHRPETTIPDSNKFVNRALKSGETVLSYWFNVWITWFLFYLMHTMEWLIKGGQLKGINIPTSVFYSLENLFNNASAIFFFCMYYELSRETRKTDTNNPNKLPIPFLLISGVLFLIELVVLSSFSSTIEELKIPHFYFALFSGLCNGVVMGLFISRLESVIFSIPLPLISFFILYAVIQPTNYFLNDDKYAGLSFAILLISFYGKTLMFIVLIWLNDTNRLTYYLVRWLYIYQQEIDLRLRGLFFETLKEEEEKLIANETARSE